MKKLIALLLSVLLLASVATGCATDPATSDTEQNSNTAETENTQGNDTETDSSGKTLTIGMSWAIKNDSLMYGMEDALVTAMDNLAEENGYSDVEWIHAVAEQDATKQATQITDLITQQVDLIICYAQDSTAIASSIEEAKEAGIPFLMWDRAADPTVTQPDAFVGLDTVAQAYTTGVALFERMKQEGVEPTSVISIVGDLADQNALNRIEGFKKAADEYGVTITQEVPSEWDSDKALSGFSAAFQANPDCNCVLIASDFIITSVQSVLESAGKWIPNGEEGHIWIGSQDVYPVGLQFIRDGYIDYDGAYDLKAMAEALAPIAYGLLKGEAPAESNVAVVGTVIDQSNVDTTEGLWSRDYE